MIPEAAVDQWEASAHPDSIIGRLHDERKTMNQVIPEAAVEADPQCIKVADVEYGQELRCSLEVDHEGKCRL